MSQIDGWHITDSFKRARMQNLADAANNQVFGVTGSTERYGTGRGTHLHDADQGYVDSKPTIVVVGNMGDSDIPLYQAAVIRDISIDPDKMPDTWQSSACFKVNKAASDADVANFAWGVAQGLIPADGYGRMVISGETMCKINLQATTDRYCNSTNGSYIPKSGGTGQARILWVKGKVGSATATGEQWALILLGGSSGYAEESVDLTWSSGDGGIDGDCGKNPTWAFGFTASDSWKTDDHGGAVEARYDYEPGFGSYSKATRGRIARKSDGSWELLYTNTQLAVDSDCCGTPPP